MNRVAEDILTHYGTPRHSGRYPWGSGENPYQSGSQLLSRISKLKKQGLSDVDIARSIGLSTTKLRVQKDLAKSERRGELHSEAKKLRTKGYSLKAIADRMGYANDSSIRSLLNEDAAARMSLSRKTADFLKRQIDSKGMIDISAGVELELNVSTEKLREALYILEMEGYPRYNRRLEQITNPGKFTEMAIVCPPGTEYKDIYKTENINSLFGYTSHDGGDTFSKFQYPKSMDSNRLQIRYAEEGGAKKDGVIEIRRGVKDLSLGESMYSQVRILVDDKKYLKGMAVYADNMPDGIDILFNTNKKQGVSKDEVLKNITKDPDNPFGSLIKANGQSVYIDANGKEQLSLINKRADEGDWDEWSKKLSSQFLAKQKIELIKRQLNITTAEKRAEYNSIKELTNPTVKKELLQSFADDCDAAAVHLKAAALPRQRYQVLLPIKSLKDTEVYAPNYKNGEKVALIRYPHGGTFEIPILTVNNKNQEAGRIIGTTSDAVGITSKVAERLSGADFDGDTVLVIPSNDKVKITSTPPLKGLEGFDPKLSYGHDKVITKTDGTERYFRNDREFKPMRNTEVEMGKISNLITDMTLKGANQDELARAVKHSMVVIDAEKHGLDYKQSSKDNGIDILKRRYQGVVENGKYHEGAGTLLSRAKSQTRVLKTVGNYTTDPETGKKIFKTVKEEYLDKKGNPHHRTKISTRMAETDDAHTLSTGQPQEYVYAEYANHMKALANQARKDILNTGNLVYSPSAKVAYREEVQSLDIKLNIAAKNAPKERQAQRLATSRVEVKRGVDKDISKSELKKLRQQELTFARNQLGAKRTPIKVTDREWEAVQAGAISENKLKRIMKYVDTDDLKQRATPKKSSTITPSKIARINSLLASGYTIAEVAAAVGLSTSTVSKYSK